MCYNLTTFAQPTQAQATTQPRQPRHDIGGGVPEISNLFDTHAASLIYMRGIFQSWPNRPTTTGPTTTGTSQPRHDPNPTQHHAPTTPTPNHASHDKQARTPTPTPPQKPKKTPSFMQFCTPSQRPLKVKNRKLWLTQLLLYQHFFRHLGHIPVSP